MQEKLAFYTLKDSYCCESSEMAYELLHFLVRLIMPFHRAERHRFEIGEGASCC